MEIELERTYREIERINCELLDRTKRDEPENEKKIRGLE